MKRIAFVLSLALTMFAVLSCGGSGAESVASFSNEIRVDDPMTFRLFDTFTLKDAGQTVDAVRKAVSITPKVDFDVQVVDGQTLCLVPSQRLDYNTTFESRSVSSYGSASRSPCSLPRRPRDCPNKTVPLHLLYRPRDHV